MRFSLKLLFVAIALIAMALVCFQMLGISKRERTLTSIAVVHRAIHYYAKKNGALPQTLDELNEYCEDQFFRDGWGRELVFEIYPKTVLIGSLGQDGAVGGAGDRADIFQSFDCYDENGVFFVSERRWLSDSLGK